MSDIIEQMFGGQLLRLGGVSLLSSKIAKCAVMKCRELGVKIIEMDAFTIHNDQLQPHMSMSIDFSSVNQDWLKEKFSNNYDKSIFLIENNAPDVFYEIVLDD